MQRAKIPAPLKDAIVKFVASQDAAREATNASNRVKTELRNAVKAHWTAEELPIGSYIRSDGLEVRYEANEVTELDNDAILKMYDDGKITREQMLRLFNVDRAEAKKILGADVVADLETTTVGDKLDIRLKTLPVEEHDQEFIAVNRNVRVKTKRSVFGKEAELRERKKQPEAPKPLKRKIKVRK